MRGEAPRHPAASACIGLAPHPALSPPRHPQSMEKVIVPSVTLIVGCGVSSLTLLLLIIIYVSVWRCCLARGPGGGGGGHGAAGVRSCPLPL